MKYALITAGGVSLGLGGVAVWVRRDALSNRPAPEPGAGKGQGGSAALIGAGISGVELVSAFPYFAAIGIIVGSSASTPGKLLVLGIYNVVYILPLIGISIVCAVMGKGASRYLNRIRDRVLTRWPIAVAPLAMVLGLGMTVYGVLGLLR